MIISYEDDESDVDGLNISPSTSMGERGTTQQEASSLPSSPAPSTTLDSEDEEDKTIPDGGWQKIDFLETPLDLINFFDENIQRGIVKLYKWQAEILRDIGKTPASQLDPYMEAICACNGSGKDNYVIAPVVVWFMLTRIRSLSIGTSSSAQQLMTQTEPHIDDLCASINRWSNKIYNRPFFKCVQRKKLCLLSGSKCLLFATDEKARAEGYHPKTGAEMLIFVNEAKSVSADIYEALGRCTGYSYWLDVSSPGEPQGDFHDHFVNWPRSRHIDVYKCAHHNLKKFDEDVRKYGIHSAYVRSKWLALFTFFGGKYVVSHDKLVSLRNAIKGSLIPWVLQDEPLRIGGDIGLSTHGDESVIVAFKGNKQTERFTYRIQDATLLADAIESDWINKLHLTKEHQYIRMDDGGVGRAVIDILARKGWENIHRVLNQSAAKNKHYRNRGAELWTKFNRLVEARIPILMDDDKTYTQIASRKYKDSTAGIDKLCLQSKKEAIASGSPSPDRADAIVLAMSMYNTEQLLDLVEFIVPVEKKIVNSHEDIVRELTAKLNLKPKQFSGTGRFFNSLNALMGSRNKQRDRKTRHYAQ